MSANIHCTSSRRFSICAAEYFWYRAATQISGSVMTSFRSSLYSKTKRSCDRCNGEIFLTPQMVISLKVFPHTFADVIRWYWKAIITDVIELVQLHVVNDKCWNQQKLFPYLLAVEYPFKHLTNFSNRTYCNVWALPLCRSPGILSSKDNFTLSKYCIWSFACKIIE